MKAAAGVVEEDVVERGRGRGSGADGDAVALQSRRYTTCPLITVMSKVTLASATPPAIAT